MSQNSVPLSEIKKFGSAEILSINSSSEEFTTRLLELGMTKGSKIKVDGRAPLGDPIMLSVRGCRIAIRKKDAKNIRVIPK
ncbi:MAG: FeoA family protein [Methanocorpusculum sp.]|nr:FeoA family protein [Methanocorpusculum sp.]